MPDTLPMRFNNILLFPNGVNFKTKWRTEGMAFVGIGMHGGDGSSASFEERTRIPGTPPMHFNNISLCFQVV